MPVVSQITDHADQAKARLTQQFRDRQRIRDLLDAFNAQTQDCEDEIFPLFQILDIDVMVGAQLDGIGEIVGQLRNGASDADYRIAIRGKIVINQGSGTPDEVILGYQFYTGSTLSSIDLSEEFPAGYVIYGDGTDPSNLLSLMEAVSVGGVYVGLLDLLEWEDSDGALWEDSDTIYVTYASSGR
jgi:hypothetical protein